ncbi:ABC transporter ATP-binding protein [Oligoflexus tunisiensis]|uniref:ABC transporter ATP-binding protein n=1 Tax=Oligoflexus tunisiensis TaxID=708132 RepID=UPI00114D1684|nr:ATP-binding cassette domain-containing protein [Oligoflexus tunisiensis]
MKDNKVKSIRSEVQASKKRTLSIPYMIPGMTIDSDFFDRKPESFEDHIEYLQMFRSTGSNTLIYSSLAESRKFIGEVFEFHGDGFIRGEIPYEFVTLGDVQARLVSKSLPASDSYLVHMLASFPSNVGGNFYLSLQDGERCVSLRLSNHSVSLRNSPTVIMHDMKKISLFSIAILDSYVYIFLDGALKARKAISTSLSSPIITAELIGDPSADLSGYIYGLEIYSDCTTYIQAQFPDVSIKNLVEQSLVHENNVLESYNIVSNFDGVDLNSIHTLVFRFLDLLLEQKGYQEWIVDFLLSRLEKTHRDFWMASRIKHIPKPAIEVEDLKVKLYRRPDQILSLKRILSGRKAEKFNALDNINFQIFPGDIVGILGHNGAGKSTLLKTIAGLVPITDGRITISGHHLLLSPGLGIREELSGRENIYLVCCFMGLSRKEAMKIEKEVIDFSELGENIDRSFKFYSDGMKSRLIFSIATSIAPEILMLDELLSAGDIKFQKKAADRMDQLIARAKIVIVVTHSLSFVETKCNKAILVMGGKQLYYGSPKVAIARYLDCLHMSSIPSEDKQAAQLSMLQQF